MNWFRSCFCNTENPIIQSETNEVDNNIDMCGICLNLLTNPTTFQKYECIHVFHKTCIENWTGSCPICRTKRLKHSSTNDWKRIPINVPQQYHHLYLAQWKNVECKTQNHNIFFKKPYGVIGVCEDCGYIQSFNLMHPLHTFV